MRFFAFGLLAAFATVGCNDASAPRLPPGSERPRTEPDFGVQAASDGACFRVVDERGEPVAEAQEFLSALAARGLSANTISRLKRQWSEEHHSWSQRDLSDRRYVYWWADGVYSNVRQDDRLCLLVIIGVTEHGHKELIAVEDGRRESEASWLEALTSLHARGLRAGPKLAIGDGALGFWKALNKLYPDTEHQRCWVHKTANVLNKVPKSVQPKMKAALHEIWMAETREGAYKAFDSCVRRFEAKYQKAMESPRTATRRVPWGVTRRRSMVRAMETSSRRRPASTP